MPLYLRDHLAPAETQEMFVEIGLDIAVKNRDCVLDWKELLKSNKDFLPICKKYRKLFKVRLNSSSDSTRLTEIFSDLNFQYGVEKASEYLSMNLSNFNRASALLRYHWLVDRIERKRSRSRSKGNESPTLEATHPKRRKFEEAEEDLVPASPTLAGWHEPPNGAPVEALFVPRMHFKFPRTKASDHELPAVLAKDGQQWVKAANWVDADIPKAPTPKTTILNNNCAMDSNGYVHQHFIMKGELSSVERMKMNVKSEVVKEYIECLQQSPNKYTEKSEIKRIKLLHALKLSVENRSSERSCNNNYVWAEDEMGFNTLFLRVAISLCCSSKKLQQFGPNMSYDDFALLQMSKEEQMENLPIYTCSECNDDSRHYLRLLLLPEVTAVAWKGGGQNTPKLRTTNLNLLFKPFEDRVKLARNTHFKREIALSSEFYRNTKGKRTTEHALCITKRQHAFSRVCDGVPTEWDERYEDPSKAHDETEIDLMFYSRDYRSQKEIKSDRLKDLDELKKSDPDEEDESAALDEGTRSDDDDEDDELGHDLGYYDDEADSEDEEPEELHDDENDEDFE